MHRSMTAGLVAVALVGLLAAPVAADGTGDAFNGGDEIGAGAQDPGLSGGSGGGGGGGGSSNPCRYEVMDQAGQDAAQGLSDSGWGPESGSGPGAWYRRICDNGNGNTTATVVWLAEPPAIDPAVLAQQALDRTPIPTPAIRLNPPPGEEQIVNVPTWMWLDESAWQAVSASASAGAVSVTTTATPSSVEWAMGNGDVVVCNGPGTPYDPARPASEQHSDCTYTYRRSSAGRPAGAFTLTATTTWTVSWTVAGAPGGGSLGTASRTSSSSVRVAEIQAVNE